MALQASMHNNESALELLVLSLEHLRRWYKGHKGHCCASAAILLQYSAFLLCFCCHLPLTSAFLL